MAAGLTEDLHREVGGAVHHHRVLGEVRRAGDEAAQPHHALHPTEIATQRRPGLGQHVEEAGPRRFPPCLGADALAQLAAADAPVAPALSADAAKTLSLDAVQYDEASFRFALNEDAMATEKLAEGIRAFVADAIKLDKLLQSA